MSKYTADEVRHVSGVCAFNLTLASPFPYRFIEMLQEFEATLRQQEQEAKRDPVNEPRTGDIIKFGENAAFEIRIFVDPGISVVSEVHVWRVIAKRPGATIIRRTPSPCPATAPSTQDPDS